MALAAPVGSTCRRSTISVSGSGRSVIYGTGSEVSIVSVVMRRPALIDTVLSCDIEPAADAPGSTPKAASGASPAAHNPAAARTSTPTRRTSGCLLLFGIIRNPEPLPHFPLLDL